MITDVELLKLALVGVEHEITVMRNRINNSISVGNNVDRMMAARGRLEKIKKELERKLGDFETEVLG